MGVGPNYAEEAINVTTVILKSPIDGVQIVTGRPWRYVFDIRRCSLLVISFVLYNTLCETGLD